MELTEQDLYMACSEMAPPIGSIGYFGDVKNDIIAKLGSAPSKLIATMPIEDSEEIRYISDTGVYYHMMYVIAYASENTAGNTHRAFTSIAEAQEAIQKHGSWVTEKETGKLDMIIGIRNKNVNLGGWITNYDVLLNDYVFSADSSPCGEIEERIK